MIRSTVAHVDLAALKSNFLAITEFLRATSAADDRKGKIPTKPPGVIGVVKANAYGHGASRVGLALQEAGATMLACADIEEGIVLRKAGVAVEILVFGALGVSDLAGVFDYDLTPTISTPGAGRALNAAAAARGRRLRYHLKIDTGMNRLGFRYDNLARTLPELFGGSHLELVAVYTHFGTANDPDHPLFAEQRERFEHVLGQLSAGFNARPALRHAANSAAMLRDTRVWFDLVRPGLLLYGVVPPPLAATLPLRPVMSLTSRLVSVKGVRPGEIVGYGGRWKARQPSRIATVPAGHADGLDMRLANQGHVLVRGRRAPIIGSVCMDMIMVDISGLEADTGDQVVIVGEQGGERLDVREMAATIGTSPYEILCRVGTRIERVYE
ncbi:MAG TPA: alanine racemase [Vicinamibacterales bacterium]